MVHEELSARLNDGGYKNWLKAGYCLLKLREGLHPFTDTEMRSFHGNLVTGNPGLRRPCRSGCRSKGNQLYSVCVVCTEWRTVILRHHTNPRGMVNWGNCRPPLWNQDHWELAKAYMPRGQAGVKGAELCDVSALLNLLNFCSHFNYVDQHCVREVIRCRNELMHSCEMRVCDQWMRHYQVSIQQLLQQFTHLPEVAAAGQQILEKCCVCVSVQMLAVDLSVLVPGVDRVDGSVSEGLEPESISQWETDLLRERLQELLTDTDTQDTEELLRLRDFLLANRDLSDQFSSELQTITSMETQMRRGGGNEVETPE
ncbi:uncharacterized protein CXorf38 homolog isoform X1 [Salvelinus fontinalis]|uniref:uncharacterized protein CXorf38 homolog isoform X1 n=1 Tax=Salvelinus fontinalis TaxID=8038 RepID=UPI002486B2F3|nr:uncharacterized protein CXorf38 homolog isoform X1 [Salvelinus fontinalis]